MTRFTGRTAVVTGAANGIGRATATALVREGASVWMVDRSDDVEAAAAALSDVGPGAVRPYLADVALEDDWAALRSLTANDEARVSILINNAYNRDIRVAHEQTLDSWNRQLAVNLTAAWLAFRAFHEDLDAASGAVVNVSSVHHHLGFPGHPGYAASKGGLVSLTRQMSVDYPRIRVNALLPGPIATQAWGDLDAATEARVGKQTSLGRMGLPDEVAAAALFLASDDASYITGTTLIVDGGYSVKKDPSD